MIDVHFKPHSKPPAKMAQSDFQFKLSQNFASSTVELQLGPFLEKYKVLRLSLQLSPFSKIMRMISAQVSAQVSS